MGKLMPLDLLSSIEGARSSEAVNELFRVIKQAVSDSEEAISTDAYASDAVPVDGLRSDTREDCPETEKALIKQNFPKEKNGFLVVPKVIEE